MTASPDPPAAHDLSGLYGREWQLAQLAADFGRVRSERTFGVSVVHGPSGIGKSALLARFLADPSLCDATVISARADQYGGDAPYAALVDGMRALVTDILGQSEAAVAHWRGRIGAAVTDPELTLALVPELALLLEAATRQPPQASLDGGGRLAAAVLQLLRAFASAERPLVIVIDNAHWLDPAAATLLEQVVGLAAGLPVMLLIGTRSRAGSTLGEAAGLGRRLAARAAYYRELAVETLSVTELGQMLADTFEGAQPQLEQLGGLVHHKTGGHPYFVRQFLQGLTDGGLAHFGETGWQFDFDGIWRRPFTDNMLGLALQGLIQLPQQLHELLGTIAVLGRAADLALLCDVSGAEPEALDDMLAPALRADVLARRGGSFVFTHDRLQEAACAMLEPSRRTRLHYAAALVLLARARLDGQDRTLFHGVDHLAHAAALVPAAQAVELATLALRAGRLARRACAYTAACGYQLQALELLTRVPASVPGAALALDIELELAHGRFLTGQLDDCAALVRKLLATVPDRFVQAQVQCLAVELEVRRGRYREASTIALDALRGFGIAIPLEPSEHACDWAYAALRARLDGLGNLAPLTDPEARIVVSLLASLLVPAAFTSLNLLFMQLCHMLELTLRHGMTPASAVSLAWLGVVVCERYRAFDDGFAYAQQARELIGRHGYVSHEAQVLLALDQASVWTQPLDFSLDCAQAGFEAARAQGDFTIACFEACHRTCILLARGDRLEAVREEIERALAFVTQVGFADVEAILCVQRDVVDCLRTVQAGGSERTALLCRHEQPGNGFAESMSTLRFWHWLYIGMLDYLDGDDAQALFCLEQAGLLAWSAPAHLHQADYHLFSILALCRAPGLAAGDAGDAGVRARVDAHVAQLASWAAGYPRGFADKLALAHAAVLDRSGEAMAALAAYEHAAALAKEGGSTHIEGIAHECAARLARHGGLATAASAHASAACAAYRRWGALGKVARLEAACPGSGGAAPLGPPGATGAIRDIDGVIRATRALSEEIHPAPLVKALMSIALEYASAQRGVLLRRDGDRLQVQASARLGADGVDIDIDMTQATPGELDLPLTLIHTALRSRTAVSVSDSQRPPGHALDPYLRTHPRCAAIAIPMIKRSQLVGMLYLENRLSSSGFTGEHTQLLSLLAAQAAVSLENANLYAELLQENRERRQAERALRESRATLLLGEGINQSGSWTWEIEDAVVNCSPEFRRIFGLDPEVTWIAFDALMARIHPGDRAGAAHLLGEASAARKAFRFEHRITGAKGEIRHLSVIGQPMADNETDIYVGTVSDVTRRKTEEASLQRAQEELVRGARLTTVGQLTAAIAHEVNQPLMSISSNAGAGLRWLQRDTPALDKLGGLLHDIVGQSQRAGRIIQTLQALGHQSPVFHPAHLHAMIRDALALARGELDRHEIRVMLDLAADPDRIEVDAVQLQQVLANLLGNAIEAMATTTGRERILQVATVCVRDGVEVQVSDNGVGGCEAGLEAMFEPFVSTKPGAIGMGLAVCRSIIEAHGGSIRAQPRAPHGCHLVFILPLTADLKGDSP
ncbi:AAA family ATPase [Oxalobacteraceae sp. CFBP 8761]|nr:AAA family ATPase [Oxalobacteraceae sp. CFBP 8761]